MDINEKIAAKNKAHEEIKTRESREYQIVFVSFMPVAIAIYILVMQVLFSSETSIQDTLFSVVLAIIGAGSICAFTLRLFANHHLRMLLIISSNACLCYFWLFLNNNPLGLLPVGILLIANKLIRK
ncbi:MAG: putative membrane-anchored protein [Glaciecola sp.]|jgi:uncharacterized membrane-anchored protein